MHRRRCCLQRFLAAASLVILAITECAPHSQGDAPIGYDPAPAAEVLHIYRCDGRPAGVTHLHRDREQPIKPCLACLRQHMQATGLAIALGALHIPAHFLIVAARITHARTLRLRKSSRGPPALST